MTLKTNKLRDAITFAIVTGVAATAGTGVAFAQTQSGQQAGELDRVTVTGSRIRQVDVETAQPIQTISRQQLEEQGFTSVADVLQNLAIAGTPPISRAAPLSSGENVGGQYIDLRNLGANRTLVLLNGRRLPITTSGLQDIAGIPTIMIERIDVLKDGASSIYGSDAIAGVINIITRQNYDGAMGEVYYGQFSEGDGAKQRLAAVIGTTSERGYITVGVEDREEKGVWAKDRFFSADSYPGYPQYSTTVVGQWGNYNRNSFVARNPDGTVVRNAAGFAAPGSAQFWAPNRGSDALGYQDFHVQTPADTSVPADQMHLMTPLNARSLAISAGWDLTDSIRWTADIGYTTRTMTAQIAGYPLQSTSTFGSLAGLPMASARYETINGVRVMTRNGSFFNPFGGTTDLNPTGATLANGATPNTDVHWRRRGWEVPRVTDSKMDSWRFATGLDGSFDFGSRYMDWQVGMLYSDSNTTKKAYGDFHVPNAAMAVGPSFRNSTGQIQCGTPSAPIPLTQCVPWNPFAGFGTGDVANSLADPAVQAFLFPTLHYMGNTSTTMYTANISGNLFKLPAGDLAYAFGVEHRKETGEYRPDALAQSGASSTLAAGATQGQYSVSEVFAELQIPLLADLPFARELTLELASRYSDYDTFGETINSKFGLKWKPIDDMIVRGTIAEGFRAPTISNLYGGGSQTFTTGFRDPCDSVYGDARGTARCLQDVPANYRQLQQGFVPTTGPAAQTPVPFFSGSNPYLQPEKAKTKTLGLVYSPSFVEGLNLSLDWWNIRIEDTMVSDSPNAILSDCYIGLIESRCGMFSRDPVMHIVNQLGYGLRNAGWTEIEGYDFSVAYRFATENLGNFSANLDSTYFTKYQSVSTNDEGVTPSNSVGFGANFRTRANAGLSWNKGDWGATWGMRYYSSMKESCYFDEICNLPNYAAPDTQGVITPLNRVGSTTFHDVQLRYNAPWNATISVGANNVAGRYGPVMFSQPSANFAYYGGFDIGRFVYMKYQQRF